MPSPVRLAEFAKLAEARGYFLHRIAKSSHHIFKKLGGGTISIPVHNGKVKYVYVKKLDELP